MQHNRFLRYVDVVARTGSIRKAAERLNVVSSAVNRRILDIEHEIGTPLFERLPRGVRLTPAGEIFVAYIRRQLADEDRARSEIEDLQGLRRGEVRLAAIEAMTADFLPRAIADFQRGHPKVAFRTTICGRDEVLERVRNFEADLGLVFSPPPDPEFRALAEIEQRLCALVAPEHPLTRLPKVKLSDCAEYPIAMPDLTLGGRQLLTVFLAQSSVRLAPALESNSFEMMRNFARLSGGVCFQIKIGASSSSNPAGLVALPLSDRGLPSGKLVVGARRDRVLPVASALFAQHVERALRTALSLDSPETV